MGSLRFIPGFLRLSAPYGKQGVAWALSPQSIAIVSKASWPHTGWPHSFDVIVGGEDVARLKPDPEALLLALQRLGLSAVDVLYVGDHPVDAEAASRAGVPFMAVLTGTSDVTSFTRYQVQSFLADLSLLPAMLPRRLQA